MSSVKEYLWQKKQKDVIVKIYEQMGYRPDLQTLKFRVLGFHYSSLLYREGDELVQTIKNARLDRYPDEELLKQIDLLTPEEKAVVMAKYGVGSDGVYVSSKQAGEITGLSSRKVPHVRAKADSKLRDAYLDYKFDHMPSGMDN